MNLSGVAKKLAVLSNSIKAADGPLEFLGLLLRDDSPDLWDVVIAAPWLKADERESFEYVANKLRQALTGEELSSISRIVILDHDGVVLRSFVDSFKGTTGLVDLHYVADGGAVIRRAYVILAGQSGKKSRHRTPKKSPRSAHR
jgi:hypothetical protein